MHPPGTFITITIAITTTMTTATTTTTTITITMITDTATTTFAITFIIFLTLLRLVDGQRAFTVGIIAVFVRLASVGLKPSVHRLKDFDLRPTRTADFERISAASDAGMCASVSMHNLAGPKTEQR